MVPAFGGIPQIETVNNLTGKSPLLKIGQRPLARNTIDECLSKKIQRQLIDLQQAFLVTDGPALLR